MSLLSSILGVPVSAADRDLVFERMKQGRSPEEALNFFRDGAQHNTHKSGALLGAQGIFAVVDLFALDHGWPRAPVFAAMFAMLLGALLVLTNLRGTLGPYMRVPRAEDMDPVRRTFELVRVRSVRFNIALYLTFLSIVLLAAAAIALI
jgi:hypothetical protein